MFTPPLGIGQIHAMHELFKADPRLAALILVLLMGIAIYFRYHRQVIFKLNHRERAQGSKVRISELWSLVYVSYIIIL